MFKFGIISILFYLIKQDNDDDDMTLEKKYINFKWKNAF